MSRYIGCETARDMLDAFLDEELAVDEQVMVESHLRWCRTCACRVEDMRLIGSSLRDGSFDQVAETDFDAVELIQSGVLLRVHAEQQQSLPVRLKELCSDMRLFWPALGATTALAICITGAFLVLSWSTEQRPESLAAMISQSQPGSEGNPLLPNNGVRSLEDGLNQYVDENRLSGGISIPRAVDDGGLSEGVQHAVGTSGDDAMFALQAIVTRDGRIANYQVLSEVGGTRQVDAILADAVRQSRFAPGQMPGGSKVAVNMVWLVFSTKAVMPPPDAFVEVRLERTPAPAPVVVPVVVAPEAGDLPPAAPLSTAA